jgi:hypothetical protein
MVEKNNHTIGRRFLEFFKDREDKEDAILAEAFNPQVEEVIKEQSEREKLIESFTAILSTAPGVRVMKHIMKESGWHYTAPEFKHEVLLYNSARRNFYFELRQLLSKDDINKIEQE